MKNTREFAGFNYGYNHTLLAQRAHDVLTVIAFAKHHPDKPTTIDLMALDGTGPIAAVALAQAGGAVRQAAIDTQGLRFGQLGDYLDVNFLPGGAKYGDLPGCLSLAAPTKLWLAGETAQSASLVQAAYGAADVDNGIAFFAGPPAEEAAAAVEWLLK